MFFLHVLTPLLLLVVALATSSRVILCFQFLFWVNSCAVGPEIMCCPFFPCSFVGWLSVVYVVSISARPAYSMCVRSRDSHQTVRFTDTLYNVRCVPPSGFLLLFLSLICFVVSLELLFRSFRAQQFYCSPLWGWPSDHSLLNMIDALVSSSVGVIGFIVVLPSCLVPVPFSVYIFPSTSCTVSLHVQLASTNRRLSPLLSPSTHPVAIFSIVPSYVCVCVVNTPCWSFISVGICPGSFEAAFRGSR